MNDCNITLSVIENLGTVEETSSNTATTTSRINPPTESIDNTFDNALQHVNKKRKKNQKAIRLKKNRKAKERALKVLKNHIDYLNEMKFYEEINVKVEMPTCPSYSIMHSLDEGFSIVMYSRSHCVNLRSGFCLHKRNGIRIILPKWMAIIWHESLYHAGGKSRTRHWTITLQDMRFFGYLWPNVIGNTRNRNVGSMDGIGREDGSNIYRGNRRERTCEYMYDSNSQCSHCQHDITDVLDEIDLSEVPENSYNPGDNIIGCLVELGWVVVRGVRVSQDTNDDIVKLSKIGQNSQGDNWHSIENGGSNRKIKYKHTDKLKRDRHWKKPKCAHFLTDIQKQIIDKVFLQKDDKGDALTPYQIGGYNLLKNAGKIENDQEVHTDYADRKPSKLIVRM
jgi:hypothetical protein